MKKGFTLLELLIVVLVISVLTAVALPQYRRAIQRAHLAEAQTMLRTLYESSERLAGEFGVRSYDQIPTEQDAISRLDMITDEDTLPSTEAAGNALAFSSHCGVYGQYVLDCTQWSYTLNPSGYGGKKCIMANKKKEPFRATKIIFSRQTESFYCDPPTGASTKACDVFGLDTYNNECD